MASDPLSVESILGHMAEALPTHEQGDTTSDLSSSYEAIALFAHACMTGVGFRLLGFQEGQKIGNLSPRSNIPESPSIILTAASSESELAAVAPRLSPRWNDSYGSYSFLYAHSQSSLQYVVKVDRLGGKAEIRGLGLGDERITRFEIVAKDYISSSALPLRIPFTAAGIEDRSDLPRKLKDIFISESRIKDLASDFKTTVIQKLIPGLNKEGYEDSSARQQAQDDREEAHARRNPRQDPLADPGLPEPARPHPFPHDPLNPPPRGPVPDFPPPGFEDEYELQRPPRGIGAPYPGGGRSPFGIGGDDLNPPGLGPHDPLRGSFVPGGGGAGPGGFGGMHPSFDDPLFAGRRGGGEGGGFDPQAPEGARWDPIGPGEGPRDRMGRGRGVGGFPGGGGGNQGGLGGNGRPPNPFGGYGSGDFI
ncbi:hypothetical protein V494_00997 [Pseudogymnoascus sp. VKM F-4513 (FW-928)]|nr:hypothetical protein V494_00997 [Pseudogymnoascus sp. VKM F-4513 (FW-928)]